MKKKVLIGIFAHPDDEAFGPAGTLLLETRGGTELHLITLTLGDAGTNPDGYDDLGVAREKEWRTAGALLGAHDMYNLGYKDGYLSNHSLIEAGEHIVELVQQIIADRDDIDEIEFMSMDLNGISGHIDHIVAGRAACWAFYSLKKSDPRLTRIRLACLSHDELPEENTNWLYMESGRTPDEIGETVDARELHDEIITIMRTHRTQCGDGETHIENRGQNLGINHFIVKR